MSFLNQDISKPLIPRNFLGSVAAEQGYKNSIPSIYDGSKIMVAPGPILVQILVVIDISKSKYSIIEALKDIKPTSLTQHAEYLKNGSNPESIIRLQELVGDDDDLEKKSKDPFKSGYNSIHKLLLQDSKGNLFYAIEQKRMNFINMYMPLGGKLILTNVLFQHGVALLKEDNAYYLGGKIDVLDMRSKEVLIKYLEKNPFDS